MKRVYFSIFILMVIVAVGFYSLVRVSGGKKRLSAGIDSALESYRLEGNLPSGLVDDLVADWEEFYKSISFAENTNELNDISRLFTELRFAGSYDDFLRSGELIKTSLTLLSENETPYFWSIL